MKLERKGNRVSVKRSPEQKKLDAVKEARGKAKDTRTDREILLSVELLLLEIREHQLK